MTDYSKSALERNRERLREMRAVVHGGNPILMLIHSPHLEPKGSILATIPRGTLYATLHRLVAEYPWCRIELRAEGTEVIILDSAGIGRHALETSIASAVLEALEQMTSDQKILAPAPPPEVDTTDTESRQPAQTSEKKTMNVQTQLLSAMISKLDRAQLCALLADESVPIEALRTAACALLGGDPSAMTAPEPEAPQETEIEKLQRQLAELQGGKVKRGRPPATASNGESGKRADKAVAALMATGEGFSTGDVIQAAGCSRAEASSACKRAVQSLGLKSFGEKRFSRYGKTEAIAKKASLAARGVG